MPQESQSNEYRTTDMMLGAYLMYAEVPLLRTERDRDERKTFFIFEKGPGHEKLIAEYFNGKAEVKANVFAAKIRDIKTLTHSR
jgi:hypothetical protein